MRLVFLQNSQECEIALRETKDFAEALPMQRVATMPLRTATLGKFQVRAVQAYDQA